MALTIGARLGPYEIISPIGQGGMGEVYRARDAKLNRDVAIKVLLPAFADDPDRLTRFEREARALAALNHPNIAYVHGLEERDGVRALVMELVDGPTLADQIERGALPLEDALPIARQIAEALDAAHAHGVIHRDLKPANIKLRPDGTVKVLDFGLAKLVEPVGTGLQTGPMVTQSPTMTSPAMTAAGFILGTAAYMAPEQAKGRDVDKRADMWAFGCVLYEMLTGARPFVADDVSDTLARVLLKDPEWNALPASTPPSIRRLLKRCFEKDPKRRLDSAAAARLEIEDAQAEPAVQDSQSARNSQGARSARSGWSWVVAVGSTIAAVVLLILWSPWRHDSEPPRQVFQVEVSPGNSPQLVISEDGRYMAGRRLVNGRALLWFRPLNDLAETTVRGTDDGMYPFFSPDGRRLAFFAEGKLKVVDTSGGPAQTLADLPGQWGGDWNRSGTILFAPSNGPIYRVDAQGGQATPVTEIDQSSNQGGHRFPRFLSDGVHFLYLSIGRTAEASGIYLGSLESRETKRLVPAINKAVFVAPDLMLFLRDTTLMAQRLDVRRLELIGPAVPVVEGVISGFSGDAGFDASDTGMLICTLGAGAAIRQLTWIDRAGKSQGTLGAPAYENPRLSPDGKRVAVYRRGDIFIVDIERGSSSRFTFDPGIDNVPLWSPDGSRIAFVSNRDGGVFNIYARNAAGTGEDELILKTANSKMLNDWSADSRYILYQEADPKTANDIWLLSMSDRKATRLLGSPSNEQHASFSPDGQSFAYESDESGARHVYVQHLPPDGSKWQVSTGNLGATPRWRPDGKEIFYDAGGPLMSVDVVPQGRPSEFKFGTPHELFRGLQSLPPHNLDVADNGNRFLVPLSLQAGTTGSARIIVTLNWASGLGLH